LEGAKVPNGKGGRPNSHINGSTLEERKIYDKVLNRQEGKPPDNGATPQAYSIEGNCESE
jgi:hypothetical protein